MIRKEVERFLALGPFPSEDSDEDVTQHQEALEAIARPVSDEEANLLLGQFGPDNCYGLAWTLLHLIETAPTPPVVENPGDQANEWLQRLWRNWENWKPPVRRCPAGRARSTRPTRPTAICARSRKWRGACRSG
jgi:hypothetical protein